MRDITFEILESLPQNGAPIRLKDLQAKVKMSSATLYKGLKYLTEIGIIERRQVYSSRAIGIEYNISRDFVNENMETITKDIDKITSIVDRLISDMFNKYDNTKEQKEIIFEAYLTIIIRFLKLCKTLRERRIDER